jgi:transglutaminase-like putative cysteine protease
VGDCEDHSILLASMLLHLGIKAWVVWGTVDEGGHAWVEVEIDDSLRLIEATRKQPLPDRLPSIQDAGAVYGVSFYKPDTDCPARTNGVVCSNFTEDGWCEVSLVGAVSI